jgi:PAP2 superfamily
MVLALVGYAAFPTAPPRMFPELGFTDTIATFAGVEQDRSAASFLVNPYAAVPSMHIAFSLMLAAPAVALVQSPFARALWSAYPLFVFFVIVATANHYWFDAAAGAAVACVAAVGAHQLARLRPEAWSWRGGADEAVA